jgi:hypothetical protein
LKQLTKNQERDKDLLTQLEEQRESDARLIESLKKEVEEYRRKVEKAETTRELIKSTFDEKFKTYNQM